MARLRLPSRAKVKTITAIIAAGLPLLAQGVTPVWGIRPTLKSLASQTQRLKPIIDDIKPSAWKDAPSSYAAMHANLRAELESLVARFGELEKDPERMTPTLDTYFRLQALETLLASLGEGVRKYQNPDLADLILGLVSDSENSRTRLREYLLELVSTREHELKIMDAEAQRCRGGILGQRPPPSPRSPPPAPRPRQPDKPK